MPVSGARDLRIEREPVDGECPMCHAASLAAYPVNSEGGWFERSQVSGLPVLS